MELDRCLYGWGPHVKVIKPKNWKHMVREAKNMSEPAAQTVRSFLHDLEEQRQIKILFAVESGSRAWRIESADSDYDVRFVYCRPLKDYVNLARPDDVINAAFDQKLAPCTAHDALYDLCGFDIFKFLRLLAKSNPSTIEWLISNVVYLGPVPPELRAFAEKSFDDGTLIRHYRSMAANNLREMEKRRTFTGKKYLYAFRGLLNAFCVAAFRRLPETDFTHTLETCRQTLGEETYAALSRLIESKNTAEKQKTSAGSRCLTKHSANSFRLPKPTPAHKTPGKKKNVV